VNSRPASIAISDITSNWWAKTWPNLLQITKFTTKISLYMVYGILNKINFPGMCNVAVPMRIKMNKNKIIMLKNLS